jgi:hypothetical protein
MWKPDSTAEGQVLMRILWPDGREAVETFATEGLFRRRLLKLELELREQNWMRPAGPIPNAAVEQQLLTCASERWGPWI